MSIQMRASKLRDVFLNKLNVKSARHINDGQCGPYATKLQALLASDGISSSIITRCQDLDMGYYDPFMYSGHYFLMAEGKFYDAENTEGVDRPEDLNYFKRKIGYVMGNPDLKNLVDYTIEDFEFDLSIKENPHMIKDLENIKITVQKGIDIIREVGKSSYLTNYVLGNGFVIKLEGCIIIDKVQQEPHGLIEVLWPEGLEEGDTSLVVPLRDLNGCWIDGLSVYFKFQEPDQETRMLDIKFNDYNALKPFLKEIIKEKGTSISSFK